MESKVNYRLVGLFTIAFLAFFAIAVVWLGKFGGKSEYDLYRVLMTESVSGLNPEASVKYRGVVVGSVKEIKINAENTELIELILRVKKGTPIKITSTASLKPQGITGLNFVDITPGDNSAKLLMGNSEEGVPTIKYAPSIFSKFDDSFSMLVDSFQRILNKTDKTLSDKNIENFSQTLQNLNDSSAKLSARLDEIGEITKNSKDLPQNLSTALVKVSTAADSVNAAALKLDRALKDKDFDLKKEMASLTKEANKLLGDMRELSRESNTLVKELQKNPSAVIFNSSTVPSGPGE